MSRLPVPELVAPAHVRSAELERRNAIISNLVVTARGITKNVFTQKMLRVPRK